MKIAKISSNKSNISKYLDCIRNKRVRSNTTYGKVGILCDADH